MIAAAVISAIVGYAVQEGLDFLLKDKKQDFESQLRHCINKTIAQFNNKYPKKNFDAIAFYEEDAFIEILIKDGFLVQHTTSKSYKLTEKLLQELPLPPSQQELKEFLNALANNFKAYDTLQVLYLDAKFLKHFEKLEEGLAEVKKGQAFTHQALKEIKQQIQKGASKGEIPKDLTGPVPSRDPADLIGREEDLKKLHQQLNEQQQALLMNGMGGIGKTTLATAFATQYRDAYRHIAWLTLENGLEEALITHPVLGTNLQLQLEEMDAEQQTALLLNKLNTLPGPNLLVLDNARQRLNQNVQQLPKPPGWQVLVTSREKIEGLTEVPVDFLSEADAVKLFKKYNATLDDETIKKLVTTVEYHTLTLEILAKAAARNRWTAQQTLQALRADAKANITVPHTQNQTGSLERIRTYLSQILLATGLTAQELYILQHFTALPAQPIEYKLLENLLFKEDLPWKEDFAATLEGLYEKGYLQKDDVTDTYKMHAVLKEVVLANQPPELETLLPLIKLLSNLLAIDQTKDNPVDKFPWVLYGEAVLDSLKNTISPEIAQLWNNLAVVYQDLGRYPEAAALLEQALEAATAHFGATHPTVATGQSNLAVVYQDLGRYPEAATLLEQALDAATAHFGAAHPTVATRQSNLALVYKDLGRYPEAAPLLEQALEVATAHFGATHPTVAICHLNLAGVYFYQGLFPLALKHAQEALTIFTIALPEEHPKIEIAKSWVKGIQDKLDKEG